MATKVKLIDNTISPTLAGGTFTSHVHLGDSDQIRWGDSNDGTIHHDGSHFRLRAGTGNFNVQANDFHITDASNGSVRFVVDHDGATRLYHNATQKIETSSAGATVSGTLTVTGDLDITGNVNSASVTDLDVTDKTITLGVGQTEAQSGSSGIIIDGSNASLLWDETNDEFVFNKNLKSGGIQLAVDTTSYNTDATLSYYAANNGVYLNGAGTNGWLRLNASGLSNFRTCIDLYGQNGGDYIKMRAGNTDALYINSAGNTGLGESSPQRKLHVDSGTSNVAARFESSDSIAAIEFKDNGGSAEVGCSGNAVLFMPAGVERARIANDGAMTLKPNGITTGLRLQGRSSDNNFYIQFKSNDGNTTYSSIGTDSANTALNYQSNTHNFQNTASNNTYMTINSSGNVGIGLDPAYKLDISQAVGDFAARITNVHDSSEGLLINCSDNDNNRYFIQCKSSSSATSTSYDSKFVITKEGNIGLGTLSPSKLGLTGSSVGKVINLSGDDCQIRLANSILHHDNSGNTQLHLRNHYTSLGNDNNARLRLEAGKIIFATSTAYTERMRIDENGQVTIYGTIGSNTSTAYASMGGRLMFDNDYSDTQRGPNKIVTQNDGAWIAGLGISNNSADFYSGGRFTFLDSAGANSYATRMIIDETGDMRFGHTGPYIASAEVHTFYNGQRGRNLAIATAGNSSFYSIDMWNLVGGTCNHVLFRAGGSGAATGSITSTGNNATQYNTSSDYRLKENVDYDWDATTRLKQLKPCRFNWIDDDTNTLEDGFLAHEVSSIVPNAVTGEKDAVYTEEEAADEMHIDAGDIKRQQLDNSKLIPLLVKTIQELEARIATLEG